jgi:hypothetical protein
MVQNSSKSNVENIVIITLGAYTRPVNSQEWMGDPTVYNTVGKASKALTVVEVVSVFKNIVHDCNIVITY